MSEKKIALCHGKADGRLAAEQFAVGPHGLSLRVDFHPGRVIIVDHVPLLHAAYVFHRNQCLGQAEALLDACRQTGLRDKGQRAPGDRTAEAVEEEFAQVKLIHAPKNLGFGGGNNLGLIASSGRVELTGAHELGLVPLDVGADDLEPTPADDRLVGSIVTATWAFDQGAQMVRVHDVQAAVHAAKVVAG